MEVNMCRAEALGITKSEVIRRGIKEVYDGLKK